MATMRVVQVSSKGPLGDRGAPCARAGAGVRPGQGTYERMESGRARFRVVLSMER